MGLKLAKLLEGEKEYLYGQNDDFWVELGVLSKKLHGGWEPDFDEMAGTLSWRKKGSEWSFLATPNWDGANNTPVTVQKDDEDVSSYAISFSTDVKKSPSENAAAYIARVVVPTINRIEHGGFESKPRLGAVLGEAMDPVAGWIPVTDKIMKHLYFKVSGKLADNKIACAWRGNGVGYAVVAPSDAERAKALVAGVLYLDKHESKLRLGAVLGEVKDLSWLGNDNRLKPLTKREGDGKGKSAVRGLRAAIKSAEEDMTPEIGKKTGRPDLGAYGRKGEAVEDDIESMRARILSQLEELPGENVARFMALAKKAKSKDELKWIASRAEFWVKNKISHAPFEKEEGAPKHAALEDAIKQASDMLKPRRDAKGRLILVGEATMTVYCSGELTAKKTAQELRSKFGADIMHVDGYMNTIELDVDDSKVKALTDYVKAAGGRVELREEAEGFSGKLAADFADLISDVEDVKRKPWMKDALISHLSTSYKHPRKDAEEFVNAYFSGKTEAGLANFGGKKAKPFEKEEAELPSAPEYAKLVFDFMKKKGNTFDAKAWQEAVDMKGVGVPMHLWSVVKGLVQKMFLGEI